MLTTARLATIALGLLGLPAAVLAQTPVSYGHRGLDCSWLEGEYQRIVDANNRPSVSTALSAGHIAVLVLTLPMRVLDAVLGTEPDEQLAAVDIQGQVGFSGSVEDVRKAGVRKECIALVRKIGNDTKDGGGTNLPAAPIKSAFEP